MNRRRLPESTTFVVEWGKSPRRLRIARRRKSHFLNQRSRATTSTLPSAQLSKTFAPRGPIARRPDIRTLCLHHPAVWKSAATRPRLSDGTIGYH